MPDDPQQEHQVRLLMYQIMLVLYEHGIREVSVGGMMRILGVSNDTAQDHDHDVIMLTDQFAKYVETIVEPRSQQQTLH